MGFNEKKKKKKKTNKKKICLIHSKEINHNEGTSLNKRVLNILNNVDHVISNSEYTKNLAINCGVNSDKITVINVDYGIETLRATIPREVLVD